MHIRDCILRHGYDRNHYTCKEDEMTSPLMKFGAPLAAAAALVGTGVVIYKTATGKKRTPAAREE